MRPADRRGDPYIFDAMAKGYLDSNRTYAIRGFPTHRTADQGRMSINRSARRHNLSPASWVASENGEQCGPRDKDCEEPDAPHQVRFTLWSRAAAREHVFKETGGDPAKLKYNPWTPRTMRYDDHGRR